MELTNGCLEIFAALVLFILLVSMRSKKTADTFLKYLTSMILCHMAVLLLDAARWFLFWRTDLPVLLIVLSVLPTIFALIESGIFGRFAITFLSQREPISRKAKLTVRFLFLLAILVWAVFILLNGVQSAADPQRNHGSMWYRWAYWMGHWGWAAVCLIGIGFILRYRQGLKRYELLSLISYCVFPLLALPLCFLWDGSQIFLFTSLSLVWIYAVVQQEQRQLLQQQENQLAQSRIAILLSQIQPHFLYNTLTVICGLCDENPKEAKKMTTEFANYLRHNLESLSQSAPIPFAEELQHTRIYLEIEQKRFEQRLRVVYDINATDFSVPPLTMQPLVENAVRHGVLKRKKGGVVTIATRELDCCCEIIISDDGVGFDPSKQPPASGAYVGTQNVRDRLWSLCRGTLTIESEIGQGTKATIKIPKEETKR